MEFLLSDHCDVRPNRFRKNFKVIQQPGIVYVHPPFIVSKQKLVRKIFRPENSFFRLIFHLDFFFQAGAQMARAIAAHCFIGIYLVLLSIVHYFNQKNIIHYSYAYGDYYFYVNLCVILILSLMLKVASDYS